MSKRLKRLTRQQKRVKFKTVAAWLRARAEKHRKAKTEKLNKEFKNDL